jgi:hypothetical protein
VRAERQVEGVTLCEDVWTCERPPRGEFDTVGLHRLAACDAPRDAPVLLYLPGMHMNGELPFTEPRDDLRLFLAVRGVRTWGLDYRTHAVPPTATPQELQTLARWTSDVFPRRRGVRRVVREGCRRPPRSRRRLQPGRRHRVRPRLAPRVAGHDARHPRRRAPRGARGAPGRRRDRRRGRAPDVSDAARAHGRRDRRSGRAVPARRIPVRGEALRKVLYAAQSFGGRGGLANTYDDVSDLRVLATLLRSYDRWWPRAALDGRAPSAPSSGVPVLAFASGRLGPAWTERVRTSADAFAKGKATFVELPAYGHLDVLVAREAAHDVFLPVFEWIRAR